MTYKSIVTILSGIVSLLLVSNSFATTILPGIEGRVFDPTGAHNVVDAVLELYMDNGDSILNGSDTMAGSTTTDALGNYYFSGLDPDQSYFVMHAGQVSELQSPGEIGMIIDSFDVTQSVVASPVSGQQMDTVASPGILGGHRDLFLEVLGGFADAKFRSNPFSLNDNLQLDLAAGVTGMAVATWDGIGGSTGMEPDLGLGSMDLTQGGIFEGIVVRLAVDQAGATQELKLLLHSGGESSIANVEFPVEPSVDPTAMAYVAFADFIGGADATSIDALQLVIDASMPSLDAQIDMIGLAGPASVDFAVTPEPSSSVLLILAGLGMAPFRRRQN